MVQKLKPVVPSKKAVINLDVYLQTCPEHDYYRNSLIKASFKGQSKTRPEWQAAIKELFSKNL